MLAICRLRPMRRFSRGRGGGRRRRKRQRAAQACLVAGIRRSIQRTWRLLQEAEAAVWRTLTNPMVWILLILTVYAVHRIFYR